MEEDKLLEKMRRISIIESAYEELEVSPELSPEIQKELHSIGIEPTDFIERFQETEYRL